MVRTGRIATFVVVGLGLLWIPVITRLSDGLYEYLQNVQAYISPPIAAVFLLGIFYKRINANGAIATLTAGFFIGFVKLTLEITKDNYASGSFLYKLADINWLVFGAYFFALCVATAIGVSLLTAAPSEGKLEGLTYAGITAEQETENKASYNWVDIAVSIGVLGLVAYIMLSFSTLLL